MTLKLVVVISSEIDSAAIIAMTANTLPANWLFVDKSYWHSDD